MRNRKFISILLIFTIIIVSSSTTFASDYRSETQIKENSEVKVYEINENGERVESDISYEWLSQLLENGSMLTNEEGQLPSSNIYTNTSSGNNEIMPMAPIGKPGSIVTYYPKEAVFKPSSSGNLAISVAVGIGFAYAWQSHGGYITIGSTTASKYHWDKIESGTIGALVTAAATWGSSRTTYSKIHQYASWSDYYNTYLLNDVITRYEGYTTSTGNHEFVRPIEVEIRRTTYYGDRAKLRR